MAFVPQKMRQRHGQSVNGNDSRGSDISFCGMTKEATMRCAVITLISVLGYAAVHAPEGLAQSANPNTASRPVVPAPSTDEFLAKVAAGNTFEIDSSKLVLRKGQSERLKGFANQMVNDHGMAGKKFKQAVSEARLPPPREAMDARHKTMVEDMQQKDVATFEKDYIAAQYDAHVEILALFEAYAIGGDNARIKQFAQEMLPTLRGHLQHVGGLR